MDALKILLRDGKFWAAIIALLNAILIYFVPDFPEPIWAALNAVFAAILAVMTTSTTVQATKAERALRAK